MSAGSPKRFELIGGPGGYLSCVPVGSKLRTDRYRRWLTLARVNKPLTPALANAAKSWALLHFDC